LNSNARVVRTSRRARDDRRMGDALARLRARLPAANDQAMASALNARAARTATTLDALCASAEAKLGAAARALREAEARTALLERALEAGTATTTRETAEAATREDDGRGADAADAAEAATATAEAATATAEAATAEAATAEAATAATPETNARASDPKYSIYFKMLKMGVPAQAVRNKMNLDGVDASVLDGR
jgi:hypothetical protein